MLKSLDIFLELAKAGTANGLEHTFLISVALGPLGNYSRQAYAPSDPADPFN